MDSYEHFFNLLNKDNMFKVGLSGFMGIREKLALYFIAFK
jgi:hypothetical protein